MLLTDLVFDFGPEIVGLLDVRILFFNDCIPLGRSIEKVDGFLPAHMVKLHVNQYEGEQLEEWIGTEGDIVVLILLFLVKLPANELVLHNLFLRKGLDQVVHQVLVDLRAVQHKLGQQIRETRQTVINGLGFEDFVGDQEVEVPRQVLLDLPGVLVEDLGEEGGNDFISFLSVDLCEGFVYFVVWFLVNGLLALELFFGDFHFFIKSCLVVSAELLEVILQQLRHLICIDFLVLLFLFLGLLFLSIEVSLLLSALSVRTANLIVRMSVIGGLFLLVSWLMLLIVAGVVVRLLAPMSTTVIMIAIAFTTTLAIVVTVVAVSITTATSSRFLVLECLLFNFLLDILFGSQTFLMFSSGSLPFVFLLCEQVLNEKAHPLRDPRVVLLNKVIKRLKDSIECLKLLILRLLFLVLNILLISVSALLHQINSSFNGLIICC